VKTFSTGFANHLAGDTTNLCYCWRIERRDGTILGFTDHDRDVTCDGTTFLSSTGITTTQMVQRLGLSVDNLEIEGALDDDRITTADIERGLYDDAQVDLYVVNWKTPTQFHHRAQGTFGNVKQVEAGFAVEFRSRAHILNQPMGFTYQRTCQAKLGDANCKVNLSLPAYTATVTITSVDGHVVVTSATGKSADFFTLGTLIDSTGARFGIMTHTVDDELILWEEPAVPPTGTVTLVAGCKQDIGTCHTKFANHLNFFMGFPYMPGNDALTNYPVRGREEYDGGSLFK
jgi:uncharacterized phage protein (TIGR02218 family)